ncbi:hypothetical protein [Pseudomonas sp. Pseusp16]|uniref:hypothetical protein n=1 Tax=Pseudomonas sp. Pseusp16 TaxID=3243021 RepID=UPI0039B6BB7F
MAIYFVVNAPSNLITSVVSTSYSLADTKLTRFVLASEKSLTTYYKYCKKNPDLLMDIGELMSRSPHVSDQVSTGRTGSATVQRNRYRDEPVCKPVNREEKIRCWIESHPSANAWNLDFEFCLGITVARAYIVKYRP